MKHNLVKNLNNIEIHNPPIPNFVTEKFVTLSQAQSY